MAMKIATAAHFEALVHRLDDGEEAGEQGRRGEQVGQDVDAAPTQFGVDQRLAGRIPAWVESVILIGPL